MDVVVAARAIAPDVLEVSFADGVSRRIDLASELYGEMFEPLKDWTLFSRVSVDPDLGTVVWPNGADLSPEFLLAAASDVETSSRKDSETHRCEGRSGGTSDAEPLHRQRNRQPRPCVLVLPRQRLPFV